MNESKNKRRLREGLLQSLRNPHAESRAMAELGLAEWVRSLPNEAENLVDRNGGTEVRWVPGKGWV